MTSISKESATEKGNDKRPFDLVACDTRHWVARFGGTM